MLHRVATILIAAIFLTMAAGYAWLAATKDGPIDRIAHVVQATFYGVAGGAIFLLALFADRNAARAMNIQLARDVFSLANLRHLLGMSALILLGVLAMLLWDYVRLMSG